MNIGDLPIELFENLAGCYQSYFINKSFYNIDCKYVAELFDTFDKLFEILDKIYDNTSCVQTDDDTHVMLLESLVNTVCVRDYKHSDLLCYCDYNYKKYYKYISTLSNMWSKHTIVVISDIYNAYLDDMMKYNNVKLLDFNIKYILTKKYYDNQTTYTTYQTCDFKYLYQNIIHHVIKQHNKKMIRYCIKIDILYDIPYRLNSICYTDEYDEYCDTRYNYTHNNIFTYCFVEYPIVYFQWLHKYFDPPLNNKYLFHMRQPYIWNNTIDTSQKELCWLYDNGYYFPNYISKS